MRIGRNEIVEGLTGHIRQCGGEPGEWCVGTAKEITVEIEDESENRMPELAHREAHTPYAAADAADYLANAFGLRRAPGSTPGTVVFVYRPVKVSEPPLSTATRTLPVGHASVHSGR
jgi:hypothetical protein